MYYQLRIMQYNSIYSNISLSQRAAVRCSVRGRIWWMLRSPVPCRRSGPIQTPASKPIPAFQCYFRNPNSSTNACIMCPKTWLCSRFRMSRRMTNESLVFYQLRLIVSDARIVLSSESRGSSSSHICTPAKQKARLMRVLQP